MANHSHKKQGRCIAITERATETIVTLSRHEKNEMVTLPRGSLNAVSVGDIVRITNGRCEILTKARCSPGTSNFHSRTLDPRRLHGTKTRSQILSLIREFFGARDFLETQTPLLVPCPGMEPHIRPFELKSGGYLPTSPEFAMKKLLVGGLERIFQICPSFRLEPESPHHLPEFTMLEWYRAYANLQDIMTDTEQLVEFLAQRILGKTSISFEGKEINVKTPWPRLKIEDLFKQWADVDLTQATTVELLASHAKRLGLIPSSEPSTGQHTAQPSWDDVYFLIWLNCIESKLPTDQAVFITHFPPSQAALAVLEQDERGFHWARRFEFFAGGLELGNAFEELTDPLEQRARFEKDMALRTATYGSKFLPSPIDEDFMAALEEGMPPSGGIAVGVDRLVMLLAGEPEIQYTTWLSPYTG